MLKVLASIILAFVLFISIAYAEDDTLILYLPFDDNTGDVATDASDYSNDGQLLAGAKWADGKINSCAELVANSYVEIPEIPVYDITDAVTLMAWIKTPSVSTWARIIDKSQWQDNGFDMAISQVTHAPLFEFFVNGTTSQALATTTVDDDEWHFIAGTFGNKKARIYVDGVMEQEITSTGEVDIKPNDWPIRLGVEANDAKGQPYTGFVDEVALYNRELSADDIQDIYQNGIDISSPVELAGKLATTWSAIKR